MKFNRTNVVTKTTQYLDIKTYFKKYLQSYLRWIYEQNNDFSEYLTTEEITNFFINELKHPLWFQYYLKVASFRCIVESNHYFEKYKKNAMKMVVEMPISLKEPIKHLTPVSMDVTYKNASASDATFAEDLGKELQLEIPGEIKEVDVVLLRQIYKPEYKPEKKGVFYVKQK